MLKRILPLFITLLITFFVVVSVQNQRKKNIQINKEQALRNDLPQFKIQTTDGEIRTNKDLKTPNHLFMIFFNPTCGHCIDVTKLICKHADLFNNSKVAFVPYEKNMVDGLPEYIKKTEIDNYPQFILGINQTDAVSKLENSGMYPQISIFNKSKELVKTFNGDVTIDELKKYLP